MNNISPNTRISFKALPAAKTFTTINGAVSEIKILKLNKKDFTFIEDLKSKIKIKDMLPEETKPDVYQKTLDNTFYNILNEKEQDAFLAVKGNKPCALMTTRDDYDFMNLVYLVSLPVNYNEKVINAGKSMMRHLLALFDKSNNKTCVVYPESKNIERLEPFYKKFGFTSSLAGCWRMTLQKSTLPQVIEKIEQELTYKEIVSANDIDLFKILNNF